MKTLALTAFWRVVSTNCHEASRLQSEGLDRPLSFSERSGLRLHLLCCRWCRRYGRQLRFLRLAARQSQDLPQGTARTLSPAARERMKQALQNNEEDV